jgi:CDP-paratose 2-epimerase
VPEEMSVDRCVHSLFGVSKLAADLLVQEYGRYLGMKTGVFRGGVLAGPHHSGVKLHGFLSYLFRCAMSRCPYVIIGYKGKQVRDIIHAKDVVCAFDEFFRRPRMGEVYNLGGGRDLSISVLEAIDLAAQITGVSVETSYIDAPRIGDHIWYISDVRKFRRHYPEWEPSYSSVREIGEEIYEVNRNKWEP